MAAGSLRACMEIAQADGVPALVGMLRGEELWAVAARGAAAGSGWGGWGRGQAPRCR